MAGGGGIGYYHVSDTYIALFSRSIACGVWEAVYILDGLLENRSEMRPDTLHADTQGQSETVFGLAYLLAIQLMPRIRNWKDLTLYTSSERFARDQITHIRELFSDTIDWTLIETHLPDILRVALSISQGTIRSSTILRKLGTYSLDVLPMAEARGFLGSGSLRLRFLVRHRRYRSVPSSGPRHSAYLEQPEEAPGPTRLIMRLNFYVSDFLTQPCKAQVSKSQRLYSMRRWTPSTPHAGSINLLLLQSNLLISPCLKAGALRKIW